MNCIHLFPVYPEIFPVFSYDKTSQHSKWVDNLNVDWSSGWILSCFVGREGKIHKPKPLINQACKEIHTATHLESIQNQYAPPNVESRPYSKLICTTSQDLNHWPSACKLSVQTTTPPVLDTIFIEQQAVILPR